MIYFYCTSWQFFQMIVKWRISPTTEQIMFTFSILLFHFYSHIPCGMWLSYIWSIKITKIISTHTSRVECDSSSFELLSTSIVFLLAHPVWDVTGHIWQHQAVQWISTHTSRVGCDPILPGSWHRQKHFYSHIPCGMRLSRRLALALIHQNFYSHIPCGMRQFADDYRRRHDSFLLTHPVWDATVEKCLKKAMLLFLLTHPVWDATTWYPNVFLIVYFYSHIPCGMRPSLPE